MAENYQGNMLHSRAIYPTRFLPYIVLLVLSKFCRAFGLFLTYDLLKLVHVVQFLFFVKAGTAVFLVFLQKPFSSGKRITKREWFRIGRHAFFGCVINVMWLFGLTQCGPLRTLLLYEHSDMVIIAGASALVGNTGGPSKFRGAVFFLIAVMGILLFDHDDQHQHSDDNHKHKHHSVITHLFNHITQLTGLSDHIGGVILLFWTLGMQTGYHSAAKKLSVDLGGAKRLHALSTMVSAVLLFPWAMAIYMLRESQVVSWTSMLFPVFLVILLVFVADYYIDNACASRLEAFRSNRFGSVAIFVSALVLGLLWNHPFVSQLTTMHRLKDIVAEDHALSGGVIFSFVMFLFATHILTSPSRGSKGTLVGYSAAGLPLYNFTGETINKTSHSFLIVLKNGLRQILEESDSRKIFYFLCINLSFTFIELLYGAWTNSLGLISDGFHMLFDCSALVMGLYAAVMMRWAATKIFSYGYDRVEILSGFINAIFLMTIAMFVFGAALTRIVDPPEIHTERLLFVSVVGLLVNLIGIVAFHHGHSHGGGGGGGHGHSHNAHGGSHGHSHGGTQCQKSHSGHGHGHGGHGHSHGGHGHGQTQRQRHDSDSMAHNTNMQGVFLHVLADTLGSVGVIISTLLIENFGWKIADPICSLFIAILIFLSVVPLVKETSLILLLRTPDSIQKDLGIVLQKLLSLDGVISYRDEHFWRHSSKVICGTIHIQIKADISEQKIVTQVTALFKEVGVNNMSVQVEKETYFQHMSGLGTRIDQVYETTKNYNALHYNNTANFVKAL